jgi:glutaredoxin
VQQIEATLRAGSESRQKRGVGLQQDVHRDVNDRVASVSRAFGNGVPMTIVCECGLDGCNERVKITRLEYAAVRMKERHYVVAHGHRTGAVVHSNWRFEVEQPHWPRFGEGIAGNAPTVELYQAEWCPHSHKVRQRLTELGLDFVARQVAADPEQREAMLRAVGTNEIPVLVADEGTVLKGEEEILPYLARVSEREDAPQHREKARREVPTFQELQR